MQVNRRHPHPPPQAFLLLPSHRLLWYLLSAELKIWTWQHQRQVPADYRQHRRASNDAAHHVPAWLENILKSTATLQGALIFPFPTPSRRRNIWVTVSLALIWMYHHDCYDLAKGNLIRMRAIFSLTPSSYHHDYIVAWRKMPLSFYQQQVELYRVQCSPHKSCQQEKM